MNINEQHCGILRLYNIHISSVYHHVSLVSVPLALGGIRKKPRTHNLGMVTTISFATSRCYNHLKSIQIHQTTHQQIHQNSFKSTNNPLKNPLRSIKKNPLRSIKIYQNPSKSIQIHSIHQISLKSIGNLMNSIQNHSNPIPSISHPHTFSWFPHVNLGGGVSPLPRRCPNVWDRRPPSNGSCSWTAASL